LKSLETDFFNYKSAILNPK